MLEISKNQQIIFSQKFIVEVLPPEKKQEIFEIAEQIEIVDKQHNNFLHNFNNLEFSSQNISDIHSKNIKKM